MLLKSAILTASWYVAAQFFSSSILQDMFTFSVTITSFYGRDTLYGAHGLRDLIYVTLHFNPSVDLPVVVVVRLFTKGHTVAVYCLFGLPGVRGH